MAFDTARRSLTLLAAILSLLACLPAAASGLAFAQPVTVETRTADALVVADFQKDGFDDLALLASGVVYVSYQRANGSLASAVALEIPAARALVLRAADIDADGTVELLVGHDHGLAVFRHDLATGFSLDDHRGTRPCWNIATADVDLDGRTDVLCLGTGIDAQLYYSDAVSGLSPPRYFPVAAWNAGPSGQAQLEDVSGDGKPDLVLASSGANSFFVSPHDGVRGFLPAVAYPYPEDVYLWPFAVEVLDLDQDGTREIVVGAPCNTPCSNLYVYRRGAQGYFFLADQIPTYDNPYGLFATDLDHDGREDLLVAHAGWWAVGRYMGRDAGLSRFELRSSVAVGINGSDTLAAGDLDHDGYTDIAVANTLGVSVLYGGPELANDFDGDLHSDLFWLHASGAVAIWPSADVAIGKALDGIDPAWSFQARGDFDGDGIGDLFARNRVTGADRLWRAGYPGANITSVTNLDWQVVGAGDFDGDGRADLFWRNARSGANVIWRSADAATQQATAPVADLRWQVAGIGDFDGDGRDDVLWRHSATGINSIWRSGQAADSQPVSGVTNLAWKVAGIGDFDGDGNDDIVWRNAASGANALWLSANAATPRAVTGVANRAWNIAAIGDYDGDGKDDLFWRNAGSGANVIWRSADSRRQQAVATVPDPRWTVVR